jgi:hypothetical protein
MASTVSVTVPIWLSLISGQIPDGLQRQVVNVDIRVEHRFPQGIDREHPRIHPGIEGAMRGARDSTDRGRNIPVLSM